MENPSPSAILRRLLHIQPHSAMEDPTETSCSDMKDAAPSATLRHGASCIISHTQTEIVDGVAGCPPQLSCEGGLERPQGAARGEDSVFPEQTLDQKEWSKSGLGRQSFILCYYPILVKNRPFLSCHIFILLSIVMFATVYILERLASVLL